jgi:hypothetical protein
LKFIEKIHFNWKIESFFEPIRKMSITVETSSANIPFSAYLFLASHNLQYEVVFHFSKNAKEASILQEK